MNRFNFHWSQRLIHWVSVIFVIGLFAVGLWMMELDYYHEWYQTAPNLHKSFGVVLILITGIRLALYSLGLPSVLATHSHIESIIARIFKVVMLLLLIVMFVSGYLITTAAGDPIYVFNLFSIPSVFEYAQLEDYAGDVHEWAAWSLIVMASLHGAAALKHHFIDRDSTLKRMLFG